MAHPSVEEIYKYFPQQSILKIVGKSTFTAIRAVHLLMMHNAASVLTMFGGGQHGHFALVTNPVCYLSITGGTSFVPPRNPGPVPIPSHLFMTVAKMEALCHQHKADLISFHTCHNTDKALKNKIIMALEDTYFTAIKEGHIGYTNRSVRDILCHLYST
eukprot:6157949-Ditylum_brightwellii.AAC.1